MPPDQQHRDRHIVVTAVSGTVAAARDRDCPLSVSAPSVDRARSFLTDEPQLPPFVERLTSRECDVLRHLPTTMTSREMAQHLVISHNTMKTHLKAIYRKLGAVTRSEAINRARQRNLL
jgi:LuxR family maltose regulon positive regulatory protein